MLKPPYTEASLREAVRRGMQGWSSYRDDDRVMVSDICGRMWFVGCYSKGGMHWHANIESGIFYLNKIEIPEDLRGQGLGTDLYDRITGIAAAVGCRLISQTPVGSAPAGDSRTLYLQRRGWQLSNSGRVFKSLNDRGVN